jgi:hypothetical protein
MNIIITHLLVYLIIVVPFLTLSPCPLVYIIYRVAIFEIQYYGIEIQEQSYIYNSKIFCERNFYAIDIHKRGQGDVQNTPIIAGHALGIFPKEP